jgi:hypothetical protein
MAVATTGATRKIEAKVEPPTQGLIVSLLATLYRKILVAIVENTRSLGSD